MIVLDSSAAVDYLLDRAEGPWVAERLLEDTDLHSPHLVDLEVASALRGLVRRRELADGEALQALLAFREFAVVRYPHTVLVARIWELRTHVTTYDAAYVALAEELGATLVTTDLRLARAHGHRARIVAPE